LCGRWRIYALGVPAIYALGEASQQLPDGSVVSHIVVTGSGEPFIIGGTVSGSGEAMGTGRSDVWGRPQMNLSMIDSSSQPPRLLMILMEKRVFQRSGVKRAHTWCVLVIRFCTPPSYA
jgi:hypothetical protein